MWTDQTNMWHSRNINFESFKCDFEYMLYNIVTYTSPLYFCGLYSIVKKFHLTVKLARSISAEAL